MAQLCDERGTHVNIYILSYNTAQYSTRAPCSIWCEVVFASNFRWQVLWVTIVWRIMRVLSISDEIYHGICFEGARAQTALAYSQNCVVINSFSKYYSMTGWRLGWMVVPDILLDAVKRLAQNLYINAPTLSQGLTEMGLTKVAPSNGAFYIYVDTFDAVPDSVHMASHLVETAGVAVTPAKQSASSYCDRHLSHSFDRAHSTHLQGIAHTAAHLLYTTQMSACVACNQHVNYVLAGIDFEDPQSVVGNQRIRLSFCGATADMQEAVVRMKAWWPAYKAQFGNSNGANGDGSSSNYIDNGSSAAKVADNSSTS
eukprot:5213-Heterococcus_DN1.PRE.1